MIRMKHACMLAAALHAGAAMAQEKVVLGGAGSMMPLAQELVKAYQAKYPGEPISLEARSSGSTGGLASLAQDRIAIALVARPLKPEESAGRLFRPVGRAPVVFAVHKDLPVTSLKEAQVCDLYAGKAKSWRDVGGPDMKVVLLSRNEDDGTKEAVRKYVGCFKTLAESPDAAVLVRATAMAHRLENEAGTIGITELEAVEASKGAFKAVTLDGIKASPETVRNGKYRLVKDYAFVTKGEPQGLAKRFLDFTASADGNKVLVANGVVPAR